jgi:hypothetical protein
MPLSASGDAKPPNGLSQSSFEGIAMPFSGSQTFKHQLLKWLPWGFAIALALVLVKLLSFHSQLIANPFQNEYREGATLLSTAALLAGKNPYALANQPEYTNVYGIVYNLFVYPFARLFGNTLPVHRGVSAGFVMGDCLLLFGIMRWMKIGVLVSVASTLIFYAHLLFYVTPLARPDAMGVFLFLIAIFAPLRFQYSTRSLALSIVSGILAFLVKPYFLLGLIGAIVHTFLFRSRRSGLKYGFFALAALVAALLLMQTIFETYLNNTFLIHANIKILGSSLDFVNQQITVYSQRNLGLIGLIALGVFSWLSRQSAWKWDSLPLSIPKLRLTPREGPMVHQPPVIGLTLTLLGLNSLVFFFSMGRHAGNWLIYMHQLLSPFLILWAASLANDLVAQSPTNRLQWQKLLVPLLLGVNLVSVTAADFLPTLSPAQLSQWNSLEQLIAQHQRVFNSPAVASILMQQGKPVFDSGQSEYFVVGANDTASMWGMIPADFRILERNNQFLRDIQTSVVQQNYDLVVLTHQRSTFLSAELVKQQYDLLGTFPAPMPPAPLLSPKKWQLDVWVPRPVAQSPLRSAKDR